MHETDQGRQTDFVFLDISKTFDNVCHNILLQKLCNFGISGPLLKWCADYPMASGTLSVKNPV